MDKRLTCIDMLTGHLASSMDRSIQKQFVVNVPSDNQILKMERIIEIYKPISIQISICRYKRFILNKNWK